MTSLSHFLDKSRYLMKKRTYKVFVTVAIALMLTCIGIPIPPAYPAPEGAPVFVAPADGAQVRGFAPGQERWDSGHRGVDIAHKKGAPVVSTGAGVVTYAGYLATREIVVINHGPHHLVPAGEDLFTVYEPVKPLVKVGDVVRAGTPIGVLATGDIHCQTACLHWGAKWSHGHSTGYLNPWLLLPHLPISLLPWTS